MLEWPLWLLSRTAVWPVFGILKSANIGKIAGGISGFWCRVLDIFFGTAGAHNVHVKIPSSTTMYTYMWQ